MHCQSALIKPRLLFAFFKFSRLNQKFISILMSFLLFLFFIFAAILLASALVVVSTRNMVHAVMFLILAFFNGAGLFILLGAEYLAMLLIIVYVGAIAVLFLFVVMMLDIDKQVQLEISRRKPLLLTIAIVLFAEIFMVIQISDSWHLNSNLRFPTPSETHNVKAIGQILYTDFILPFQISGAILFVAMIGAITLTLKEDNRFIKKQKISDQVLRNKANSLAIASPKIGEGINL